MSNADDRIAEVLRKRSAGPEQFDLKRQDGTEKLVSQPTPLGQIESSVHFSTWKEVDEQPKTIRVADQITLQDEQPAPKDEFVVIGNLTISPSHLTGFQRAFTRDAGDYVVTVDGNVVQGQNAALAAIYAALLADQKGKRK